MRGRVKPAVGQVLGFAGEIELSYQAVKPALDGEVNVRRPDFAFCRRIAARFYRTKIVSPGRICREAREAFEIWIERRRVDIARVTIFPCSVGLPDIDARMRHRLSRRSEHAAP